VPTALSSAPAPAAPAPPAPATVAAGPAEGPASSNATVTDGVDAATRPRAPADVATKSALQAGDPRLGRSTALLGVLLSADKAARRSGRPSEELAAADDRELAKRAGAILLNTPYGAPSSLIVRRLAADPLIAQRFPKLQLEDLLRLHDRFPAIVPRPNLPLDLGSSRAPTAEGYIDLFVSHLVRAGTRLAALAPTFPDLADPRRYVAGRYQASPVTPGLDDTLFPAVGEIVQKTNRAIRKTDDGPGLELAGTLLRRVITNAPPQWGPKEIAEEHNRYLDFYAPLMLRGMNDSLEEARDRARMTPERVQQLMTRFPAESGAAALAERQERLRTVITAALSEAKPGDNLYDLLTGIADRYAAGGMPAEMPKGGFQDATRFARPPQIDATIRAEDLLAYVSGDPALADAVDQLIRGRHEGYDKILAKQMAKTLGNGIARLSIGEIAAIMAKKDPVYNELIVRHLLDAFPELFKAAKVETGRVELNFVVAKQVADVMNVMFEGATLTDVAQFLKAKRDDFAATYPELSAEDLKLLQAAYPFLPQWEVKPKGNALSGGGASSLSFAALFRFATNLLGSEDARKLEKEIFQHLSADLDAEALPAPLKERIDSAFAAALLKQVSKAFKIDQLKEWDPTGTYPVYQEFLSARPGAVLLDTPTLTQFLSKSFRLPPAKAAGVAAALLSARKLDFDGLQGALSELLLGQPNAEQEALKVMNLGLGHDSLCSRIELEVFKNRDLKATLKKYARIPLRLPMIQSVVDKYQAQQPLKDTNVLMVQHILGQAYPQIAGYKQLGMKCEDAIFVGIPYHRNEEVADAIGRSFGIDVRIPPRDMMELYRAIEKGVDDLVAKHRENGKPCLVVCDGPHAREYFKKQYPELALSGAVRFTEQTAFGDRPEYRSDKSMRVVSYARTELKAKREAKFIGQAVARAVNAVEIKLKTGHEQKPVLILGYGPIGQATAEAFAGDRAEVYVYDPYITKEAEAEAVSRGYRVVKDKSQIAAGKFLLIGCSGHLSIDEEVILSSDPNAIYVSASSKLVEINMKKLGELATDEQGRVRKILAAEVNDQQTWHYWLKDGTIRTVVADGLPANFNDINSVPPEWIDMTMALGLAAAVETMIGAELGYYDLNTDDQRDLGALYDGMVERISKEARDAAASKS
jgi:S-adenosylhomocysteine hydrolase